MALMEVAQDVWVDPTRVRAVRDNYRDTAFVVIEEGYELWVPYGHADRAKHPNVTSLAKAINEAVWSGPTGGTYPAAPSSVQDTR